MKRAARRKPWRMRAKFKGEWTRAVAFGSESAARSAARIEEELMGASETEVWRVKEEAE